MSKTHPRDETGTEIMEGDLVFYDGQVFKVAGVHQILGGWELSLINSQDVRYRVISQKTTALGADFILGLPKKDVEATKKLGIKKMLSPDSKQDELECDEKVGGRVSEEEEEDDRPPQSVILAPTEQVTPLFPEFAYKPGMKVYRVMGKYREREVEGIVVSVVDSHRLVVQYQNYAGGVRTSVWPIKEISTASVYGTRTDMVQTVDRFRGGYGCYDPREFITRRYDDPRGYEPPKSDSISRADLISQEARRLANEDRRATILKKGKGGEEKKPEAPKIKTRKGEW